jgi:hypothetical protein
MLIRFDAGGEPGVLVRMLQEVASAPEVGLLVVLACDANNYCPADLDPVLRECGKPLVGGVFPQIISDGVVHARGTIVAGLACRATTLALHRLDDPANDFEAQIDASLAGAAYDRGTLFTFVDGRSGRIGALIDALFNTFGLGIDYLGGGAGSLVEGRRACVICNQGLLTDAAVLAMTDIGAGIGVAHGWQSISQAFRVTEAQRNTIVSLDWRPAFEVYREVVEPHAGRRFDDTAFFDLAKAYPFGIAKLDDEMVVRDPLVEDCGRLVCVGEVERGAYVHVLHGNVASLVDAAGRASLIAQSSYRGASARASVFLIDCISRVLFLQDSFASELAAVKRDGPLIGALTLGEIANSGRTFLEFYNKTVVVGLLDA